MSMDTGDEYAPDFEDAPTIPAGVSNGHNHGMGGMAHHGGMGNGMNGFGNGGEDAKRPPRLNFAAFGHSSDSSAPMISSDTSQIGNGNGHMNGEESKRAANGGANGANGAPAGGAGAFAGFGFSGGGIMPLGASYEITAEGTFKKGGWEINRQGVKTPPKPFDEKGGIDDGRPGSRELDSPSRVFTLSPEELIEIGNLGKGASGFVKKCIHRPTLSIVALKCIDMFDKSKRHQLLKELNALSSGQSTHLVTFLGGFYDAGSSKLALEYMSRGSLQDVIEAKGPLSEEVLASVAKQVLLGLHHLHAAHTVHRDIKPANILVSLRGQVKITDFGILAELSQTQDLCKTFAGTAVYMSPERIQSLPYSTTCDIWSLGMLLVTCALGKFPFKTDKGYFGLASLISEGPPPQLSPEQFSPACRSFVAHCLVKDPTKRPSALDLLKHPFVMSVDENACARTWPFDCKASDKEMADLDLICQVMLRDLYPQGRASYKRSLLDLARFERIAWQLGLAPEVVQKRLESLLT